MMEYPCDKCDCPSPVVDHCVKYKSCPAWVTWFRTHWKKVNEYAELHHARPTTKEESP